MGSFLYNVIVKPLELIIELVFAVPYWYTQNPILSIVAVSVFVNILTLPLYRRSDALQSREREKQKAMKPWVTHIRKTFRGDEQFMILSTYYRQQGYKPYYSIRGSLSLLFQIPFFIAAYHFLSHLTLLNGVRFWLILDLGSPDGMLHIGSLAVNVLPILMTAINLVSSTIYTRGFSFKERLQLYIIAAIFLVLLYDSPSGLVLYWTLNNFFSLCKNIFMKLVPQPKKVISILTSAVGVAALILAIVSVGLPSGGRLALAAVFVAGQLPLAIGWLKKRSSGNAENIDTKRSNLVYGLSVGALLALWGLLIPATLTADSPQEFLAAGNTPGHLIFNTFSIYLGVAVWLTAFYLMSGKKARRGFAAAVCMLFGVGLVDYLFFGRNYGTLSPYLVFDARPRSSAQTILLNLAVVVLVAAACYVLYRRKPKILQRVLPAFIAGMAVLSAVQCVTVQREVSKVQPQTAAEETEETEDYSGILPMSRNGKNVVVFMLDRAISGYIPYIFQEKPEIKEAFSDFTYYPNTLSFSHTTNMAAPALYGGYEYTPEEIDKRPDESLKDKNDEALSVLPVLFWQNGYTVTVCEPPYAGYQDIPDLSIYDEYDGISAYSLAGKFSQDADEETRTRQTQERNFVFYSLFKTVPVVLQETVYGGGEYMSLSDSNTEYALYTRHSTVLDNLTYMTEIVGTDGGEEENTFLILKNNTTHSPAMLSYPDYQTSGDFTEQYKHPERFTLPDGEHMNMDTDDQLKHYCVNVAALERLAVWIGYLKEEGVYDNTRIIFVADHGRKLGNFDRLLLDNGVDAESYNPLLLVKDFDAEGFTVSDEFMTNADTPAIAVAGLFDDPVNPFTGKTISSDAKHTTPLAITTSSNFQINKNNGNQFDTSDGEWYIVKDNIFDPSNWERTTAR